MNRRTTSALLALVTVPALLTGCGLGAGGQGGEDGGSGAGSGARAGSALAAVDTLTVKGRAPKTGYDRGRFGSAWADTDSNGCPTRDDILKRDLTDVTYQRSRRGDECQVVSGRLAPDPYTGRDVPFRRGRSQVDIDHLVALSDAWQKGAARWAPGKRIAFANDPLNLVAVDAGPNRSKGDGDTATWLPPRKAYRCAYVAGQVAVKRKYGVWVTAAERNAMKKVLSTCPTQKLPPGPAPTTAPSRFHAD
ncbi:HNH endonuclease [Streptomyces sp. G44]|uniref:HNH endonuclease family protein n=1 Tax=Streptomyces sp. G44 TaxID=2807632 RepID=UPI0019602554|nr:HNH endonuclease family protein [Streptomyces sp. G44]MBM7170577.1 HNH endonuclease [Streptomyces sp. G44]